ncbi:MAG: hypothetical protein Q9211_003446 [Gyalolechia sp. 1 TL-2023]
MASSEGDSPREFDVADSQANMDWLNHQNYHAQTSIYVHANGSSTPAIGNDEQALNDLDGPQFFTRDGGSLDAQNSPTIKAEEASEDNVHMITDTTFVDLTLSEIFPEIKHEYVEDQPFDWKETISGRIELSDTEDEQLIKRRRFPTYLADWKKMPSHIDISDSADESDEISQDRNFAGAHTTKNPQLPQPSEAIEVSDNEIHQEQTVNDKRADDRQVEIGSESSLLTATPKVNLGNSLLRTPNPKSKRSAADIATMKKLQAKFRAKALGRNNSAGGTEGNNVCASAIHADREHASARGLATASVVNLPDDNNNMNRIIEDDEGGTPGNPHSNNEPDSLFIPQENPSTSRKRPLAATVEDGSDEDLQEIDGSTVPETR